MGIQAAPSHASPVSLPDELGCRKIRLRGGSQNQKVTRRPRLSTDLSRGEGRRDSHACEPTWSADAGSLVMAPVSNEQRLAIWADIESALLRRCRASPEARATRRIPAAPADARAARPGRERELRAARTSPPDSERGMSEQPRDEQGRLAGESGTEMLNRLLRERSRRSRVAIREDLSPGHVAMNQALLRAAGKIPPLDDAASALER